MCKTSKPGTAGPDEKRDGAGGGFNERQERVASAKTEVGEDGYDDFGIRKKKVKASKAEREAAALARLQQSYGYAKRHCHADHILTQLLCSAIFQPTQRIKDSTLMHKGNPEKATLEGSNEHVSQSLNEKLRRSRSPAKSINSFKLRSRSRDRSHRNSSREKHDRRNRSPVGRSRDRRRSHSRSGRDSRDRDRSRRDRRYR